MFEVSNEFFPLYLPRLLRKLANLGASMYSVRFSVTILRMLFRRLMVARSSGFDHDLVCLPILGLPTRVLAAEIKVLLRLRTRSRRKMGSGV